MGILEREAITGAAMFSPNITVPLTKGRNQATVSTSLQIQRYRIGVLKPKADTASERFFCVRNMAGLYGRVVWSPSGRRLFGPVRQSARLAHPDWRRGSGTRTATKETITMPSRSILTIKPARNRAARYRAQALSALHADSSLSVRLKRYNAAMAKARDLESRGGAQ